MQTTIEDERPGRHNGDGLGFRFLRQFTSSLIHELLASYTLGDEETASTLKARVDDFDGVAWWDRQQAITRHLGQMWRSSQPSGRLCNPYKSEFGAWQLSESIENFLDRLPPAPTDWRPGLDWIWVANPRSPPDPGRALTQLRQGGEVRLALFAEFQRMAAATGTNGSGRTLMSLRQDVDKERRATVQDLRELAAACNVVSGKWMLFPEPGDVNEVWAKVAKEIVTGGLGIGAKVETRGESGKARLICVYTRDFGDKDDVAKVLHRMTELELVSPGRKQVYYKSDAWTELGIYGGNVWGIKVSTYSSNEIFGYIRAATPQRR